MNKNITCRPCKEKKGQWEIQDQKGTVREKHYNSKYECVKEGRSLANEYNLDLVIENENGLTNSINPKFSNRKLNDMEDSFQNNDYLE